ncbi:MAG TPA: hypothetical protein VIK01_03840 [Polyangiaceae bacterium]
MRAVRSEVGWVLVLLLAIGCAGHASADGAGGGSMQGDPGAGAPGQGGGSATGGLPATGGAPPAVGGAPQPAAGAPNDNCLGALDELNALEGPECPAVYCAASDWATDCTALSGAIVRSTGNQCEEAKSIELTFVNGDVKICYYPESGVLHPTDPRLGAVAIVSQARKFCDGTATKIATSSAPTSCSDQAVVLCDASTSDPNAPTRAASCFDAFSGSCGVCCPSPTPDCSDKPDGYGGGCVAAEESFCSCFCQSGKWSCAC